MKNKSFRYFVLCLSVGGISSWQSVQGYNYNTHDELTVHAVSSSQINQSLPTIGLRSLEDQLTNLDTKPSCSGDFVCPITQTAIEWIRTGAKEEDATFLISENKDEVNDDDLNIARYQHHFYDPINNSGYSYGELTGYKAPDWGLEDTQDLPSQNFSLKDARDYLYRGLTQPDQHERETNLARFFKSLGHALHLIEDMGQPQHTRNDSHGGFPFGDKSLYEAYTELDDEENPILSNLPFSGYAPVTLANARDYWYTDDQKGLADYSNRGFVSAGTNFDSKRYAEPKASGTNKKTLQALFAEKGLAIPTQLAGSEHAIIEFVQNVVKDKYRNQSATNYRAASKSIFSADLEGYNQCDANEGDPSKYAEWINECKPLFTLNRFNFDSAHQLLIPRAVGYGAGLINHFFRGQLEISPPNAGYYFDLEEIAQKRISTIKLNLKNVTPTIDNVTQNMSGGKLVLVAKYRQNLCYVAGWYCPSKEEFISVSKEQKLNLAAQATQSLTFDLSSAPIPINVTDLSFQIVYQGQLGEEEAVVVATQSPTYRGRLQISLPDEGLYSIVDHATVNQIDQGFTTVKLKLKNLTPDVNDIPQNMRGGKLVLVAKYYRNECYQSDLTGEYSTQELNWRWKWEPARKPKCTNQKPYQEVSNVSAIQSLPSVLEPQADPIPLTFEFSKPIPLNATDLFFEVIYHGQLGEYKVMMAVTKDIAEPTYFSVMNVTDYFVIDKTFYQVDEIYANSDLLARLEQNGIEGYQPNDQDGDRDITPYGVKIELRNQHLNLNNQILLASLESLQPATYFRVALLVDRGSFKLSYWEKRTGYLTWHNVLKSRYSRIDQRIMGSYSSDYELVQQFRDTYHDSISIIAETLEDLSADPNVMVPLAPENLAPKPITIHFGAEDDS
jgi:hypothetical protein